MRDWGGTERLRAGALAGCVLGAAVAAAQPAEPLQRRVDAILDEAEYAAALWSVEVRDLETGRTLVAHHPRRHVQPASTLKLLSTAAALDAFGPAARFATTVETAARIDGEGRLLGDLYLVGGGDLGLSSRFAADGRASTGLEELARGLRAAGVRRVDGRVVGRDGLFPPERRPEGWDWDDLVWWYGAEISALAFNDNAADLRARAGTRVGAPLAIERDPVSAYYEVVSIATTSARGTQPELRLRRPLGGNRILLTGTWPLGAPPWKGSVALEDPPLYAATVFAEVLARAGIPVGGVDASASLPLPEARRVLARHEGPPLGELIREVNKESLNLHAEVLLRMLGVSASGDGSLEAGREALLGFLSRQGVDAERWAILDGSGLSESDLVSARGLVDLLAAMARHPHAAVFEASLPVSGVDGTLERRLRGGRLRGRVRAKTGTLRHVNALAGYATALSGRRLAFAIFLNHYTGERGQRGVDRLLRAVLEGA